jgi:hypothetical protein
MKKILLTGVAIAVFAITGVAQPDHDFNPNDKIPVTGSNLT